MEKYLRTKDEIFELQTNLYNQLFAVNRKGEWFEPECIEKDIIAQANELKNLIDCIVIDYGHYKHFATQPINGALVNIVKTDYTMKGVKAGVINVYGAIWCKWGLKYVAKLNEKGDLELIRVSRYE